MNNIIILCLLFVFSIKSYGQIIKQIISVEESYRSFGDNFAVSKNYAIIAAPYENRKGQVYIYHNNNNNNNNRWNLIQEILPPTESNDNFGRSIDISKNFIIISFESSFSGTKNGVSIYKKKSSKYWELQKTIVSEKDEDFGSDVSITDNYAIIGARFYSYLITTQIVMVQLIFIKWKIMIGNYYNKYNLQILNIKTTLDIL